MQQNVKYSQQIYWNSCCSVFVSDSLLLALSRVLRDDWKKSIDLTTNIIYVFFCFSTFTDFHKMLTRHKVCTLTLTLMLSYMVITSEQAQ